MSLTLTVDGERWRRHLLATARATPGIVPVAKGNGYGFGNGRLARRTQWLREQLREHPDAGPTTLAVGTYAELPEVSTRTEADLLVLTPWRPWIEPPADLRRRLVHTVSRVEDVDGLLAHDPGARLVLEQLTSMRRHGLTRLELAEAADRLRSHRTARLAGVAVHLPLAHGSHLGEVLRLVNDVVASGLPTRTVWVSHLSADEVRRLRATYPDFTFRPRVGTDLWLGDRGALSVTARVLDVHPVERGQEYGYRGRGAPRAGHLVIVSGGTAHGIGLEAPTGDGSLRSRAATLARGGLDAVGFVRSPYLVDGKQRLFAEPPHMQASMLFLPEGSTVPDVGDRLEVRVRFTATWFDRVEIV